MNLKHQNHVIINIKQLLIDLYLTIQKFHHLGSLLDYAFKHIYPQDLEVNFLNCKVDSFPFKYIGLTVGAYLKKEGIWYPLVNQVTKSLAYWKNSFVSLCGKVILVNLVINSILVFFLSFMKILMFVWNKLISL